MSAEATREAREIWAYGLHLPAHSCCSTEARPSHRDQKSRTFRCSLRAMRLHRDVRVEMIQCTIGLFTSIPATFVHSFNFLVSSARALVLLSTGDGNKGIDLDKISD